MKFEYFLENEYDLLIIANPTEELMKEINFFIKKDNFQKEKNSNTTSLILDVGLANLISVYRDHKGFYKILDTLSKNASTNDFQALDRFFLSNSVREIAFKGPEYDKEDFNIGNGL